MEEKQQSQAEVNDGGTRATDIASETQERVKTELDEVTASFNKARREMVDAVSRLKREVAQIDTQQARRQAQDWIQENPTLATFIGIGAGILVGRVLSEAFKPAPPPPLHKRAEKRVKHVADQAQDFAGEAGEVISKALVEVGELISAKGTLLGTALAANAGRYAGVAAKKTGDLADTLAHQASELGEAISDRSRDVGDLLVLKKKHPARKKARRMAKSVRKSARHSYDVGETILDGAKALLTAVLVKRATKWVRRLT